MLGPERGRARRVHYTPRLVAYVSACALAAIAVSVATLHYVDDWAAVLIVAAVVAVMSQTTVRAVRGVEFTFTASLLLHLGSTLTFGAAGAVSCAIAESLGPSLRGRADGLKWLFNTSINVLSNVLAVQVFRMANQWPSRWPSVAGAALLMGLAQNAINYGLIMVVVRLAQGSKFDARQFVRSAAAMLPYGAVYGFSALAFGPLHSALGLLGLLTLVGPLLAAQLFLIVMARANDTHAAERRLHLERIEQQNQFLEHQNARVERAHDATLIALTHALDARDKETEGHSRRVVEYSRLLARHLGLDGDAMRVLSHGALLHDIGKIGVPDAILHKPAALTEEEWAIMRTHPQIGYAMVDDVDLLHDARMLILHHHERWDGSGYPRGLRGTQIDRGARIFAVADALDAITQDRPYRRAASMDEARSEILRFRGRHFDPEAVDAFLSLEENALLSIARLRSRPGLDLLVDTEARNRYLASLGLGAQLVPS